MVVPNTDSLTPRLRLNMPRPPESRPSSPAFDSDDEGEAEFDMPVDGAVTTGSNECDGYSSLTSNSSPSHVSIADPPLQSSSPRDRLTKVLQDRSLDFPINVECTSLCLSPSGNFLWAGFSDGTLRVFDMSGQFPLEHDGVETSRQKSFVMVASKFHQRFGAVACQINARGVHTDLLMHVDTCGDYVFGGVIRGAVELYAVSTKDLEDAATQKNGAQNTKNILDHVHCYGHMDAKLKGFGACTQLENASRPTYLLLTGRGIKNIHIWKFQPPIDHDPHGIPVWELLYDTQTNGNTIHLLNFYRNPKGSLIGVSRSDDQKLCLWDLSKEEENHATGIEDKVERPKRPPYQNVANSQGALGIVGDCGLCGGATMYNQFSIVSLSHPKASYNHTELALPGVSGVSMSRGSQRRGELKQVVKVATLCQDSHHALLELDDGSIVHYEAVDTSLGRPKVELVTEAKTGIPPLPGDYWCRTICLGKPFGIVVAAVCVYNPNTQQGRIVVRSLERLQPQSPAVDRYALTTLCMEGPTSPLPKKNKKKKRSKENYPPKEDSVSISSVPRPKKLVLSTPILKSKKDVATANSFSSAEDATTGKSQTAAIIPRKVMETPVQPLKSKNAERNKETPDSASVKSSKSKRPEKSRNSARDIVTPEGKAKGNVPASGSTVMSLKTKKPSSSDVSLKQSLPPAPAPETPDVKATSPGTTTTSPIAAPYASTMAAQVSPSAPTPPMESVIETPSPIEPKHDQGTISKFLKPKRLLHRESKKDATKLELTKVPQPASQSGSMKDVPTSTPCRQLVKLSKNKPSKTKNAKPSSTSAVACNVDIPMVIPRKESQHVKVREPTNKQQLDKKHSRDPSAAPMSLKRPRADSVTGIASLLVDLKSTTKAPPYAANDPKVTKTTPIVEVPHTKVPAKKQLPRNPSETSLSQPRDRLVSQKATDQYKHLESLIANLPKRQSRLLTGRGNRPNLKDQHLVAHQMIQRKLLLSALASVRSLLEGLATVEATRCELRETIRSYEEVLFDTIQRQQVELNSMPHGMTADQQVTFPFQAAFQEVEAVFQAIEPPKRPPGRPKSSLSNKPIHVQ
eukprot:Nitzschia sp. Nitz4//scaffold72_size95085//54707//58209//NITZ4_004764-RA/size95085-processed-gene-0.31-mRNA-1//-1//CDS//3329557387//6927//frame0